MSDLLIKLINNQDIVYQSFTKKLIPDTKFLIIGVRSPIIKKIAKEASQDKELYTRFFNEKHLYYEECLLHGAILGQLKINISETLTFLDDFMPYIDNWSVCDCTVMCLKIFKKHKNLVFSYVKNLLKSDNPYAVRFAIVTMLSYFLGDNFNEEVLDLAKSACCENYYVNMSIAWLFSVALVKNYNQTVKYIENKNLPKFVHNKSIQKAKESYRITADIKNYLNSLKI
jgi:3-methyladenine DNA glycosylase AlkD